MNARTFRHLSFCLLVAALATGCTPLRPRPLISEFREGPSTFAPGETGLPAEPIPGGTVVSAGGTAAVAPQPVAPAGQQVRQAQGPAPATPLPIPVPMPAPIAPPRPLHAGPVWAAPGDPQQPQQPPVMVPPAAPPGTKPLHPNAATDPHVRNTPTAAGGRLGLAPYEVPTDRVVELTTHLERLLAQNRDLAARVKELEAAGANREQALVEAAREVDAITADAAKSRAALQAQIGNLQGKIKQLEEEDIIFLRAVIDALGRLVPPEKKP